LSAAGVVAALRSEARTLGVPRRRTDGLLELPDGTLVAVSGIGAEAAAAAAERLLDAGATALVSWGMAGGLDPSLAAGTICLPEFIVARDGRTLAADHHWRELLAAAVAERRPVGGRLLTSDSAIGDVAGKAAAFRDCRAVAVDMESLAVAGVAALRRVPFVAVRVIVDTAADALPPAVVAASGRGPVHLGRLLRGLLRRPRDLQALLRLGRRYRIARRALIVVARTGALAPLAFSASSPTRIA
jgi:adenosylhomocysteine nucleosidase